MSSSVPILAALIAALVDGIARFGAPAALVAVPVVAQMLFQLLA